MPPAAAVTLLLLIVGGAIAWPALIQPRLEEQRLATASLSVLASDIRRRQDDPRFLYFLGKRLNDAGRFSEADPFLRHAVGLDPDASRLRAEWARALVGSGLITAAFGQLKEYAGTHPDLAESHFLLGQFYRSQNSMNRAAEELTRATEIDPNHAEAWRYLATSVEDKGRGIEAAKRAVALKPREAEGFLVLAPLLEAAGTADEARAAYARAAALQPGRAGVHREYAAFLIRTGRQSAADSQLALSEARRAVELDPQDALAHLTLGRALLQTGRDAEAILPLQEAAERDRNDPAPALTLRQTYLRLGRQAEAAVWQRAYAKRQAQKQAIINAYDALRANGNNRAAHRRLARLLARQGDIAGCLRQHAALLHVAQDAPPTLTAAANDLIAEGRAQQALPLVTRAVTLGQMNPNAQETMGNALLALGRSREAAVYFAKVVSLRAERYDVLMARLHKHFTGPISIGSPAQQAYRKALRLRAQQVGPRTVTREVMALSHRAVELEPDNPEYLRFLLQNLVRRRENKEAIGIGERLVRIAPKAELAMSFSPFSKRLTRPRPNL